MQTILRFVLLGAVSLAPLCGHNLWITAEDVSIRIVFEHSMQPGEGNYNDDIVACGKTWVRTPDGKTSPVSIEKTGTPGKAYLAGETRVTQQPRSVEFSCVFGIYKGRMDYFYGQFIDVSSSEDLAKLAKADLPIDIVPSLAGDTMTFEVVYEGEALPNHRVAIIGPDGSEEKFRTDASGKLVFKPTAPGIYGVWSVRLDDEITGEHEGVEYKGNMHATSLAFEWPIGR